jgi:rhamnulokinase
MEQKNYLVFDLGATNIKSILFRFDGKNILTEELGKFENKPVLINDSIYWNIFEIFSNIKAGIKQSVVNFKNLESVGIDGWGSDFCIFDRNKKIISNPVHYRDKDRLLYSVRFYNILPREKIFELTGHATTPLIDLFQLFSLKVLEAPEIREGYKYLSIPDSLNYFLSGNMHNEYTRATTSGLVNLKEKKWEKRIIEIFGFSRNIFGDFISPGTDIGKLSDYVCKEMDIKPINVIATVSHDTAAAVSGIPVRKEDKEWAFLSMGTWFCFGTETAEPMINKKVFSTGFANEAAPEGKNLLFKNLNGFYIIEKCKEIWEEEEHKKISWEKIISLSDEAKPFNSFIDNDNSIFYDYQFDMPEKIRLFCKKSGQIIPNTMGDVARCIFESLVFKVAYNIKLIEEIIGCKLKILYLMGGVTQNRFICQWIANATNILIIVCPSQTSSIGNFLIQLKACNEIKDLQEVRSIVLNSFETKKYYPEDVEIWNNNYIRFYEKIIKDTKISD